MKKLTKGNAIKKIAANRNYKLIKAAYYGGSYSGLGDVDGDLPPEVFARIIAEIAIGLSPAGPVVDAAYVYDALVNKPEDKMYLSMAIIGFAPGIGDAAKAAKLAGKASKPGREVMEASKEIAEEINKAKKSTRGSGGGSGGGPKKIAKIGSDIIRYRNNLGLKFEEFLKRHQNFLQMNVATIIKATGLDEAWHIFKSTDDPVKLKKAAKDIAGPLMSEQHGIAYLARGTTSRAIKEMGHDFAIFADKIDEVTGMLSLK